MGPRTDRQPNYRSLSDTELVERARRDEGAFSELVRRYRPGCLQIATTILRDRASAEDAVQDSLLKAFVHFDSFEQRANFRTWLCSIVINDCKMVMRRARRAHYISISQPTSTGQPIDLPSSYLTPEENRQREEIAAYVYLHADRLPVRYRKIVTLLDLKGFSLVTVAENLGISPAAAKTRLIRARRLLRDRLRPHFCTRYSRSIATLGHLTLAPGRYFRGDIESRD